jgi:hypothetical protein
MGALNSTVRRSAVESPGGHGIGLNVDGGSLSADHLLMRNLGSGAFHLGSTGGSPTVQATISQAAIHTDILAVGSRYMVSVGNTSSAELTNCTIVIEDNPSGYAIQSANDLVLNNCLIVFAAGFYHYIDTITFEGDNNIYVFVGEIGVDGNYRFTLNGSSYVNNFSGWQSATGQDANSEFHVVDDISDIFTGDPSAGDFRINTSTDVGAAIVALGAGVTEHWDFNKRAIMSGPPEVWPVGPASLSEAQNYVKAPTSWDFYP